MRTLIIVYIFTNPSVISYMNTVYLDHIYLCKYPICSLCPTPWKSYFKGEKSHLITVRLIKITWVGR